MSAATLNPWRQMKQWHDHVPANLFVPAECPAIAAYAKLFPRAPLPFVEQHDEAVKTIGGYELYIEEHGAIPTRPFNWHDYYNALCWNLFPLTKRALHDSQIAYQDPTAANKRSPQQNGATLFDENGVIVMATESWVSELLRTHQWRELFWHRRDDLKNVARIACIGHAIWEKCREPYIGMTAKWLVVEVAQMQLRASAAELFAQVDELLARRLPLCPKDLKPLPLLGWPGICEASAEATFYDDIQYFRPSRGGQAPA